MPGDDDDDDVLERNWLHRDGGLVAGALLPPSCRNWLHEQAPEPDDTGATFGTFDGGLEPPPSRKLMKASA